MGSFSAVSNHGHSKRFINGRQRHTYDPGNGLGEMKKNAIIGDIH